MNSCYRHRKRTGTDRRSASRWLTRIRGCSHQTSWPNRTRSSDFSTVATREPLKPAWLLTERRVKSVLMVNTWAFLFSLTPQPHPPLSSKPEITSFHLHSTIFWHLSLSLSPSGCLFHSLIHSSRSSVCSYTHLVVQYVHSLFLENFTLLLLLQHKVTATTSVPLFSASRLDINIERSRKRNKKKTGFHFSSAKIHAKSWWEGGSV